MEVIVKTKKERKSHGGGGCTKNGIYCEKEKKSGGGFRVDANGDRSKAFVKIQKKIFFFFFFWGGGGGHQGGCERRREA